MHYAATSALLREVTMEDATYVVHLVGRIDSPFKHFRARADARVFADGQVWIGETERASIFKVSVTDSREAIIAVKSGKAELVDVRHSAASDEKIQRDTQRDWENAVAGGPKAILRFLGLSADPANTKRS
jgi:hypothetical protein